MLRRYAAPKTNRLGRIGTARALCELIAGMVTYGVGHWRRRSGDLAACECGVGLDCDQCNTKHAFKMNTRVCSA